MDVDFTLEDVRVLVATELQRVQSYRAKRDDLLTRGEAANMLGVKVNTLALWACQGRGPAPTKIGSRVLYRRAVLADYIELHTLPRIKGGR